jgi:DNA modification methylase
MGSGSTLIAGQMLDRRVYGCELEPRFCDLIVRRFEKLTGIKAKYNEEK